MKQSIKQTADCIYVQARDGTPLMPTFRKGKVKWLLRLGNAIIVCHNPFTIRLLYDSEKYVQKVSVGVDLGSRYVGISATTESNELLACQVELRHDVVKNMSQRRESRRTRRSRKTRYRKVRFNNRKRKEGWLPPSVAQKAQSVKSVISRISKILPVGEVRVEVGKFDVQKLENPDISGTQYQSGRQLGFQNVKAYVFCRDEYKCRKCKGKSGDPVLVVHHIETRLTGGDSPGNMVTLCKTCHDSLHRGEIDLEIDRIKSYRDATHMNIMKNAAFAGIVSLFGEDKVKMTYGYITKYIRMQNDITKSHLSDAQCISGNPNARQLDNFYAIKMVPRHTRSLHVMKPSKGGVRRSAVAPHWIGKSRLQRYDFVKYRNIQAFIAGSTGGRPVLRNIDWTLATDKSSVTAKSVKFLYRKKGSFIIQKMDKKKLLKPIEYV